MSQEQQREILLSSERSSIFTKDQSSNLYKFFDSISKTLSYADQKYRDFKIQVTVNSATSSILDEHGRTYDLPRFVNETDDEYRTRLISSYARKHITKNNLKSLSEEYATTNCDVLEYVYDRWWLSTENLPNETIELSSTIDETTIRVSKQIRPSTIPETWDVDDISYTGTNYSSGSSFTNDASGSIILLSTPVSGANYPLRVIFTQAESTTAFPTTAYDDLNWQPIGFLNYDTYLNDSSLNNNFIVEESTTTYLKVKTKLIKDRIAYVSLENKDLNIIYEWECVVDENGYIYINEENRIDSKVNNESKISSSKTSVVVNFPIARVIGVWADSDTDHLLTNYATNNSFNGKTINLDSSLPFLNTGVVVGYIKNPIIDYTDLDSTKFAPAGEFDPRFVIEIQTEQTFLKYGSGYKYGSGIRWGQLVNENAGLLGEIVDIAKAAGVEVKIKIVQKIGGLYGEDLSIYGEFYYS